MKIRPTNPREKSDIPSESEVSDPFAGVFMFKLSQSSLFVYKAMTRHGRDTSALLRLPVSCKCATDATTVRCTMGSRCLHVMTRAYKYFRNIHSDWKISFGFYFWQEFLCLLINSSPVIKTFTSHEFHFISAMAGMSQIVHSSSILKGAATLQPISSSVIHLLH